MTKLAIESEHGFDFFIDVEAHDQKVSVRLHKDDPHCWRISSSTHPRSPALNHWVASGKMGYPEALKRALMEIEMECANLSIQNRRSA